MKCSTMTQDTTLPLADPPRSLTPAQNNSLGNNQQSENSELSKEIQASGSNEEQPEPILDLSDFGKLPPELRGMIWKYMEGGPRIIDLFNKSVGEENELGERIFYSHAKNPVTLSICKESRNESLPRYTNLGESPIFIYFKANEDTVLFHQVFIERMFFRRFGKINHFSPRLESQVKKVAVTWSCKEHDDHLYEIHFPSNERLGMAHAAVRELGHLDEVTIYFNTPPGEENNSVHFGFKDDGLRMMDGRMRSYRVMTPQWNMPTLRGSLVKEWSENELSWDDYASQTLLPATTTLPPT